MPKSCPGWYPGICREPPTPGIIPDPVAGDRIRTSFTGDGPQDILDIFDVDETHVLAGYADLGEETAVIFEREHLRFYATAEEEGRTYWNGYAGDWR